MKLLSPKKRAEKPKCCACKESLAKYDIDGKCYCNLCALYISLNSK